MAILLILCLLSASSAIEFVENGNAIRSVTPDHKRSNIIENSDRITVNSFSEENEVDLPSDQINSDSQIEENKNTSPRIKKSEFAFYGNQDGGPLIESQNKEQKHFLERIGSLDLRKSSQGGQKQITDLEIQTKGRRRKRQKRDNQSGRDDPLVTAESVNIQRRRTIHRPRLPSRGRIKNKLGRRRSKGPTRRVKIKRRLLPEGKAISVSSSTSRLNNERPSRLRVQNFERRTRIRLPTVPKSLQPPSSTTPLTTAPTTTHSTTTEESFKGFDYDLDYDYLSDAYDEIFGSNLSAETKPQTHKIPKEGRGKSSAIFNQIAGASSPIPLPAVHLEAISRPNRLVPFPVDRNQVFLEKPKKNTLHPVPVLASPAQEETQQLSSQNIQETFFDYDYDYSETPRANVHDGGDLYEYVDEEEEDNSLKNNIFNQFSYGYRVDAKETGNFQSRTEARDGKTVTGSYEVALPDGRIQIVTYVADGNGFRADVSYQENTSAGISKQDLPPRTTVVEESRPTQPKVRPLVNRNSGRFPFNDRPESNSGGSDTARQSHFAFENHGNNPVSLDQFRSEVPEVLKNPRPTPVSNHLDEDYFDLVTPSPEFRLTPRPVSQTTSQHFVDTPSNPRVFQKTDDLSPFPIFHHDDDFDDRHEDTNFGHDLDFDRFGSNRETEFHDLDRGFAPNFPIFTSTSSPFEDTLDSHLHPRPLQPTPRPIPPLGHREVAKIPPNPFLRNRFNFASHQPIKPEPKKLSLHGFRNSFLGPQPDRGHVLFPLHEHEPRLQEIPNRFSNRNSLNFDRVFNTPNRIPNEINQSPQIVDVSQIPQTFRIDNNFRFNPVNQNPFPPNFPSVDFTEDVPLPLPSPNPFRALVKSVDVTPFTPEPPTTTQFIPHTTPVPVTIFPVQHIPPVFSNFVTPEPDYDIYDLSSLNHIDLLKITQPPDNFIITNTPSPLNPHVTTPFPQQRPSPLFFQYSSADGTPSPTLFYNPDNPVFLRSFGQTHAIPLLLPIGASASENSEVHSSRRRLRQSDGSQLSLSESERTLARQDIYPEPSVRIK